MTISAPRTIVITLHDAAPPFEQQIQLQLNFLAEIGVKRCVLNVVPDWHGRYPLEKYPSFVRLLREQSRLGSQIVLHGFNHCAGYQLHGGPTNRVRARLFAPGTAEFLALTPTEAAETVRRGLNRLRAVGVEPSTSFCPPGWLITPANRRALSATSLHYLIGMFGMADLQSGRWRRFPSVGFMGAGPAQETGVSLMNAAMLRLASSARMIAIYLHPQVESHDRSLRRILALIGKFVSDDRYQAATFEDWNAAG